MQQSATWSRGPAVQLNKEPLCLRLKAPNRETIETATKKNKGVQTPGPSLQPEVQQHLLFHTRRSGDTGEGQNVYVHCNGYTTSRQAAGEGRKPGP